MIFWNLWFDKYCVWKNRPINASSLCKYLTLCSSVFQRLCFLSFELSGPLQVFWFTVYWEIVSVPRTNTSTWCKSLNCNTKWRLKNLDLCHTFMLKHVNTNGCKLEDKWNSWGITIFFIFYILYFIMCRKSESIWQGKSGNIWLLI